MTVGSASELHGKIPSSNLELAFPDLAQSRYVCLIIHCCVVAVSPLLCGGCVCASAVCASVPVFAVGMQQPGVLEPTSNRRSSGLVENCIHLMV